MQRALAILECSRPYHFASVFGNCRDADVWNELYDRKFGKTRDTTGLKSETQRTATKLQDDRDEVCWWKQRFDMVLGECGAVNDAPCISFWKELIDTYPDAKVILVERDEEKWLASIRVLVEGLCGFMPRYVLIYTDPLWTGRILGVGLRWADTWFETGGRLTVERAMNNARRRYREHYDAIRQYLKEKGQEERLLEYKLGSGWGPLCKHLHRDLPDVEFPWLNEKDVLEKAFGAFVAKALRNSLFNISTVVGTVALAVGVTRRYIF